MDDLGHRPGQGDTGPRWGIPSTMSTGPHPSRGLVHVVVNPLTVDDPVGLRARVQRHCRERGCEDPVWRETTPVEHGRGLAREAVSAGAGLVICCGGDGTVTAVADGLAGSAVPLALLPAGTGDLLARNLGIPLDTEGALSVAFDGTEQRLDLARVGTHVFAVMAGVGLDARMMCDADPESKKRWGWPAYVVAGLRHLFDPPMRAQLTLDGAPLPPRRARAVLVGNVGRLQAGARLLPDADPTDGVLDVAVLAPRTGVDWLRVVARILLRRRREDDLLRRHRARTVELRLDRPQPFELDGDVLAPVARLHVEVVPAALSLRVPTDDEQGSTAALARTSAREPA